MIMDHTQAVGIFTKMQPNTSNQIVSALSAGLQSDLGIHFLIRNLKENKENAIVELRKWVLEDPWTRAKSLANAVINDKNPALDSLKLILLQERLNGHVDESVLSILREEINQRRFSTLFDIIISDEPLKEILQNDNTQCDNDAFRGLRQNITATVTDPANVSNNERYTHAFQWLCSQYPRDENPDYGDFRMKTLEFLGGLLNLNHRDTEFQYRNPGWLSSKVNFSIAKLAPSNESKTLTKMVDMFAQYSQEYTGQYNELKAKYEVLKLENRDLMELVDQKTNTRALGGDGFFNIQNENRSPSQSNVSTTNESSLMSSDF